MDAIANNPVRITVAVRDAYVIANRPYRTAYSSVFAISTAYSATAQGCQAAARAHLVVGRPATRKLSFAATWMNRRLFVEVILACNRSKDFVDTKSHNVVYPTVWYS